MFITLEGIEGSGKTTQIDYLVAFFEKKGKACVTTREPGGTVIGNMIRAILLDPECKDMDAKTELLLYMADRAQHIHALVKPALADGKTVLCDRYFDATLVYQGYARGLDIELIKNLHSTLFEDLKPDVTILLDLPPQVGLQRAWKQINNGQRSNKEGRFEEEKLEFHQRVREGYLELANVEPDRFHIIDASQDEQKVRDSIIKIVDSIMMSP
ncbi:MAG: dTMP kinase [Desulfobacterales bacterium]|jgi:dTMP kinase